ncbi:MAG: nucleotide disphospho-sugar-binding domain-containing protein [Chloroflexota bacterium]
MANILIISGVVPARINANLAYATCLKESGHTVSCASPADVSDLVASRGFAFYKLKPESGDMLLNGSMLNGETKSKTEKLNKLIELIDDDHLLNVIDSTQPDLVMVDCELPTLIMKAYVNKVPIVLLSTIFTIWKFPNVPPLHNVAVPGQGRRGGRLAIDLLWRKYWLTLRKRRLNERRQADGIDRLTLLKAYGKKVGFPFAQEAEPTMWMLPFSFKTLPIIATAAQEMDLPHTPKPNFYYAGPILHIGRSEPAVPGSDAEKIRSLLTKRDKNRPLVYASTSSIFEADTEFLGKIIKTMEINPQWDMILALGKKLHISELGGLPNNIYAFSWVPQLDVIEQANCVITHGGVNTLNESLWFGKPLLVYSGNFADQNGNGARVAYHNVGIVGSKSADGPAEISAHINQLLTDSSIKRAVQKMSQSVQRYTENNTAVKIVEQFLK